nr:glycine-rich cell wall structural protein-like [Quercus suber]
MKLCIKPISVEHYFNGGRDPWLTRYDEDEDLSFINSDSNVSKSKDHIQPPILSAAKNEIIEMVERILRVGGGTKGGIGGGPNSGASGGIVSVVPGVVGGSTNGSIRGGSGSSASGGIDGVVPKVVGGGKNSGIIRGAGGGVSIGGGANGGVGGRTSIGEGASGGVGGGVADGSIF